jgi:glycosyltransferase involved in cell wall biosynthesis
MFFPRGGSAHVTRALARELPAHGCEVTIVSGSRSNLIVGDAERFYEGLDVHAVDFTRGDAPMHPSYEDRPDAPDRVFAALDDDAYEEHVSAWSRALEEAGAAEADLLHLHHLTPIHEAARRVAPSVPVVGHLHGTELLMLERIEQGPPPSWRHADAWAQRMRDWAQGCERILLLSSSQLQRARDLLDIDPSRCVIAPNGFDPERFKPRAVDRPAFWQRVLVQDPHGWRPGAGEGSVSYGPEQAAAVASAPVLVSVSRFTEVKRLGLLIRAFARAREATALPASLVLVGGYPGEWEGEHPYETIQATDAGGVYLAGWHDHDSLAGFFAASDAVVLASVREQFGSVLVEGMACGLPAVAVDRLGPSDIVRPGQTGWLVEPDDEAALAGAVAQAIAHPEERLRRGAAARRDVLTRFAWPALADRLCVLFSEVAGQAAGGEAATAGDEAATATADS